MQIFRNWFNQIWLFFNLTKKKLKYFNNIDKITVNQTLVVE